MVTSRMSHFLYFQMKLEGDGGCPRAIEESSTGFEPHSDDGQPPKNDNASALSGPKKGVEPAKEEDNTVTAADIAPASGSLTPPADSIDMNVDMDIPLGDPPIARAETADTVVQKGTRMEPLDVETEEVIPPPQKALTASGEVVAAVKREGGGVRVEATPECVNSGDRRVRTAEAMPVGVAAAVAGDGSNVLFDGEGAVSEVDKGEGEGNDAMLVSKKRTLSSGWDRDCDGDNNARMVMDGQGSSGEGESEREEHPRKR